MLSGVRPCSILNMVSKILNCYVATYDSIYFFADIKTYAIVAVIIIALMLVFALVALFGTSRVSSVKNTTISIYIISPSESHLYLLKTLTLYHGCCCCCCFAHLNDDTFFSLKGSQWPLLPWIVVEFVRLFIMLGLFVMTIIVWAVYMGAEEDSSYIIATGVIGAAVLGKNVCCFETRLPILFEEGAAAAVSRKFVFNVER